MSLQEVLAEYTSLGGAVRFFQHLGYPVQSSPVSWDVGNFPEGVRELVRNFWFLAQVSGPSPFRIYHIEVAPNCLRRTDVRRILEAFHRRQPQGNGLFVFSTGQPWEQVTFVSPLRLLTVREDPAQVRLWLRFLEVRPAEPYRTDLDVLSGIQVEPGADSEVVWQRHQEAFSVQRVTERFFQDYREAFHRIREHLRGTHPDESPEWARDYTHLLLNRLMFLYFIQRKGWLQGPDGQPSRRFLRDFWTAYRDAVRQGRCDRDTFHSKWLPVLFFEAFNNRWQNRAEYAQRFPTWLQTALAQAPYLNGGLYTRNDTDGRLAAYLPDAFFELLFDRWVDGTPPGLFERYNFTIVESGRWDEEVAVDPEMLGRVYESLVNVTFEVGEERDLRGQAGIFYTPRTEIDLMCRLALVDWLAGQVGKEHRELLYRWVFAYSEEEKRDADEGVTDAGLWERLDECVRRVTVCDPAVGSGSFLIGMLLLLDDLQARCNQVLGRSETAHERRTRILGEQLYGVDVMEWAVRVAELRLWLQLVVETELHPAELHFRPLLPNLNFKLRPGDSLLQTVGDLDLSRFRRAQLEISQRLKGHITALKGRKKRFFSGEDPSLTEEALRKEERALFRQILEERIVRLESERRRLEQERAGLQAQMPMPGMASLSEGGDRRRVKDLEQEIQEKEEELDRLREAHEALRPDQPSPFVWDIAFVEIFEREPHGFDIVIGNPPYVRQEKISDPLGRFGRRQYLDRLQAALKDLYPNFFRNRALSGRADYYLYFYLHGLSLLNEKGVFCFITSNSWLDVDFGKDLQEFLLRHSHIKMVVDNRARRSFAQADVNTVIVLLAPPAPRPLSEEEMRARPVRFVAFRVPFEEALSAVTFLEVEDEGLYRQRGAFRLLERREFRSILLDQWQLFQEGLETPEEESPLRPAPRYVGNKWGGKYLRAPDIFFTLLEKGERYRAFRFGEDVVIVEDVTDTLED